MPIQWKSMGVFGFGFQCCLVSKQVKYIFLFWDEPSLWISFAFSWVSNLSFWFWHILQVELEFRLNQLTLWLFYVSSLENRFKASQWSSSSCTFPACCKKTCLLTWLSCGWSSYFHNQRSWKPDEWSHCVQSAHTITALLNHVTLTAEFIIIYSMLIDLKIIFICNYTTV